jgi:hypothetical protein
MNRKHKARAMSMSSASESDDEGLKHVKHVKKDLTNEEAIRMLKGGKRHPKEQKKAQPVAPKTTVTTKHEKQPASKPVIKPVAKQEPAKP